MSWLKKFFAAIPSRESMGIYLWIAMGALVLGEVIVLLSRD